MSKVVIQVNYVVKEDKIDEFIDLLKKNSEKSLNEPGCLNYEAAIEDNNVFLYEKYTSMEAFEYHKASPHFAIFGPAIADLLESKEVRIFEAI